jgi:hypothetical protein
MAPCRSKYHTHGEMVVTGESAAKASLLNRRSGNGIVMISIVLDIDTIIFYIR